jgi:hypothetical protein
VLLLDSEFVIDGLTLFADHAAPETFHYVAGAPRLVVPGDRPALQVIRYRGLGDGGGLLLVEAELSTAPADLAAAARAIESRTGRVPALVPVLFDAGAVRLTVLGVGGPAADDESPPSGVATRLVERVVGTATPSLLGAARASFAVRLTAEGTQLVQAALAGTEPPLMLVYELTFRGLRPARGVRATVDHTQTYEYLRTRGDARSLWFAADLDREAEALHTAGAISIEDVDYAGLDPALRLERQREIRDLLRELMEAFFFRPATSPGGLDARANERHPSVQSAWTNQGGARLAFVLRSLEQDERQTLTYDRRETSVGVRRIAPQAMLALPAGTDPATLFRDVDLEEAPMVRRIRAFSPPEADWRQVRAVEIEITGPPDTRADLIVTADAREQAVTVPAGPLAWRARVLATPEPEALGAASPEPTAMGALETDAIEVDPARLGGRRIVTLALGTVDPSVAVHARGRLTVADRSREFLLDGARPQAAVAVWGSAAPRLSATLAIGDDASATIDRTMDPGETLVPLNPPPDLLRSLVVMLQDPLGRYEAVFVEIDAGHDVRRALRLDAGTPRAACAIPRAADRDAPYRVRTRRVFRDARVAEDDWREAASTLLIVGDTGLRVEDLDVVLTGAAGWLGAVVTLTSLAPPPGVAARAELVFDDVARRAPARLPFASGVATRYRVEGQVFYETAERTLVPYEDTSRVVLVRVPPA